MLLDSILSKTLISSLTLNQYAPELTSDIFNSSCVASFCSTILIILPSLFLTILPKFPGFKIFVEIIVAIEEFFLCNSKDSKIVVLSSKGESVQQIKTSFFSFLFKKSIADLTASAVPFCSF